MHFRAPISCTRYDRTEKDFVTPCRFVLDERATKPTRDLKGKINLSARYSWMVGKTGYKCQVPVH